MPDTNNETPKPEAPRPAPPPKPINGSRIAAKIVAGVAIRAVVYTVAGPLLGEVWANLLPFIHELFFF